MASPHVLEGRPPRSLLAAFVLSTHPDPHLVLLGAVEAVSALLFLIPRTSRWGAAGLLLTLLVAWAAHAFLHEVRWDLLVYAAAVTFVAVHGPLSRDNWKVLFARRAFP
jgi:uncharacterized membrane protein YphA (DoxX/SURF4 family)